MRLWQSVPKGTKDVKEFLFVMQLLLPTGALPPQTETMPTLEACLARATDTQTQMAEINEDFRFTVACVQTSKKANPA